ncbi:hypothetical protein [Streptomyces sp. NPDC093060]|uniref:hypothetical protein n=1 Tax=Streptomyces sp. NPDC093060 TaxID=3366019 RepID=UPI00382E51B4
MSLFGRRERREIAELNAYVDRLRTQRDKALKDAARWKGVAERASEMFTDTSLVNDRLTDANLAVARRLTRALKACARYRAALNKTATEWMAECQAHALRADRLQRQLDDSLGLNTAPVVLGATGQDRREQKMRYDK